MDVIRDLYIDVKWRLLDVHTKRTKATRHIAIRKSQHHDGFLKSPYITALVLIGLRGVLYWSPIVPRAASLSDNKASFPVCVAVVKFRLHHEGRCLYCRTVGDFMIHKFTCNCVMTHLAHGSIFVIHIKVCVNNLGQIASLITLYRE